MQAAEKKTFSYGSKSVSRRLEGHFLNSCSHNFGWLRMRDADIECASSFHDNGSSMVIPSSITVDFYLKHEHNVGQFYHDSNIDANGHNHAERAVNYTHIFYDHQRHDQCINHYSVSGIE